MSENITYWLIAHISRVFLLVSALHLFACDFFVVEINGRKISGVVEARYPNGVPRYIGLRDPQVLYAGDRPIECVDTYKNSSTSGEPGGNTIGYPLELHDNGSLKLAYPNNDFAFTIGGTEIVFRKRGFMRFYRSGRPLSGILKQDVVLSTHGGGIKALAGYVSFHENGAPASLRPAGNTRLRCGSAHFTFRKGRIIQLYPDGSAAAGTLHSDARFFVQGCALEFIAAPGERESVPSAFYFNEESSWMEPSSDCTIAFHRSGSIKSGFYLQKIAISDPMRKNAYKGKAPVLLEIDEGGVVRKGRIVITPEITKYVGGMMRAGSKDFGEDYNRPDGSYDPPNEMDLTVEHKVTTFRTYRY